MVEVFGPAEPVWQIQAQLAQKVLQVNSILAMIDSQKEELDAEEQMNFLQLLLELESVFLPELLALEDTKPIVDAFELYKVDKAEFMKKYPFVQCGWFYNASTREERFVIATSEEAWELKVKELYKREFRLKRSVVLPDYDMIIELARVIVRVGLEMDILRFKKREKPVAKFGDVYANRGEAELAIEELRRG